MVLAFLRAEIDSERYKEFFPQDGAARDVACRLVEQPSLETRWKTKCGEACSGIEATAWVSSCSRD